MQAKNRKITKNRHLFAEHFRNYRRILGLSQRELSKKIGLAGNTQISKFENGTSEPSITTLRKLADIGPIDYELDLHELITGKPCPAIRAWREENKTLLELLAKYISRETSRLLDERHKRWGELGEIEEAKAKAMKKEGESFVVRDNAIVFLKAEIARIERQISDIAEDQNYVQNALNNIKDKTKH